VGKLRIGDYEVKSKPDEERGEENCLGGGGGREIE